MPKASSNSEQTSSGSQRYGTVESMKVRMGLEDSVLVFPVVSLNAIECRPTTKSRDRVSVIENDRLFGIARASSYPPKVSVPRVPSPAAT